jgi:uncharacterized protein involved in response to NO
MLEGYQINLEYLMKRLALAPHRLYFFLGVTAVALLFSWWWLHLNTTTQPVYTLYPLHALLMPLGIFPLFILGFTFTAGPRWLSLEQAPHHFLLHGISYFVGLLLVLIASSLNLYPLRVSGFMLMLAAWCAVTIRWFGLINLSRAQDKKHAWSLAMAMCGGACAMLAALLWSLGLDDAWRVARTLALYAFLLPTFVTVCHRMLPFFSGSALKDYVIWRPYWLLAAWVIACWLLALSSIFQWRGIEAFVAALLSLSFANTSWRWGLFRSLSNRLLAMLHLSFAWLPIAFALESASVFNPNMGSASVHALALGFMCTMLVAFVSRVSFGHSGRPLQVSRLLWTVYLCLHVAAFLRVLASLSTNLSAQMMSISVSLSGGLLLIWIGMMLPIYLRARVDGKAG